MAETHELTTIAEVAALYRKLPSDRADLMLKEVCDAVRLLAPMTQIIEMAGANLSMLGPLKWINDTKGVGTFNLRTAPDGDPDLSLKFDLKSEA